MSFIDLDKPILSIPYPKGAADWTIRDAVEGVQIFGGIGSGKTSGSGRMLALKYLSHGFGGLVLSAKPDEKDLWIQYCKETNRLSDLAIIEPNGKYHFNFLEYEASRANGNDAITDNIVQVLKTVIMAGKEKEGGGGSDDGFWQTALDMLLFNVIDLCRMAYGDISVERMYEIVQSIPKLQSESQRDEDTKQEIGAFDKAYDIAHSKVLDKAKEWYQDLSPGQKHAIPDDEAYNRAILEAIPEARLLKFLHEFFLDSFKNLSPKTRSIIEFTFSGFLFRLLREPVYSLFCKHKSNVVPDDCLKGKIILINLPVKVYHKVGRDCQILFKYIWQRAMERRTITPQSRPVFLWADEAQNFLHEHDAEYQATARSSRISTVYISQNLPNYYASMGGQKAEYRVKSFLGTLGTKIFHANADIETNRYSSELFGDVMYEERGHTVTTAEKFSQSDSFSLKMDKHVRPEEFMNLKTGGPRNAHRVEGFFHKQGNSLFGKYNFTKANFNQNRNPNL